MPAEAVLPARILGIDPGLRVTGFGVIDHQGPRIAYVTSGVIRTEGTGLPGRLKCIFDGVLEVIDASRPQEVVVEQVFVNVNPQSTLLLGQARGAAICAAVSRGLPVAEYSAAQVKQAVVGSGRAAKAQVQHMVRRLLALPGEPTADAADALACAICHAHRAAMSGLLERPGLRQRRGRVR